MSKNMKKAMKVKKTKKSKEEEVKLTRLGAALRTLGGIGGRAIGGMIGYGDQGGSVGTGLGATISRWLGSGDYEVRSNSIVRQSASGSVPEMHRSEQVVTVRHREYLTEVTGKQAFTVLREFSINPGLPATFPWLNVIAAQYTEYRLKGMVYHYVPTSGNAVSSTNAALGSVMLQTTYRASESTPTSKQELLNEYWASESKPSEAFCHPIECDPKENPFNIQYVRTGNVPSGDNVLLYDLGKTVLAVSGQQADDIVLGDLWVTYEVELRKPRMAGISGSEISTFLATATSGITSAVPFGTNASEAGDTMSGTTSLSTTALTLGPGNTGTYMLTIFYQAATAFSFTSMGISGTGSAAYRVFGATNPRVTQITTGTGATVLYTFQVSNPNTTTVITPNIATLTGATGVYVYLSKINSDVVF